MEFSHIHYDVFETDSSSYILRFMEKLDIDDSAYTDFVVVGGDGLFSQLLNEITKHPQRNKLMKMPIGFMP